MKKVAVIGLGKVGSLVGTLLSDLFTVTGFDQNKPATDVPFQVVPGSIKETAQLENFLSGQDAVVSCLPYNLNLPVAQAAYKLGIHYFDLTEDVSTTAAIREMAKTSKGVMAPQCGLAPGFIGIVGADLYGRFTKLRDVELRVGALPRYPNGLMGYSFTWSPAGVINEYINDAEVIHNGERKMVPSLEGVEMINIEGQEFEAFTTSGGLGTMCETLSGKVDTLNYKTMRYPGHAKLMRFLLYELILKEKRELVEQILTEAKPPVREDVVYVYAVVEGWKGDQLAREEFYHAYHPILINGKEWRAISWTTAASVAAVVEMVANGTLANKGFIKQEEISYQAFIKTKNGSLYESQH
ncbi:saccharopine dehydrogenase family protein [Flavihumibacter profundi]|jgi:saccharopine dehydrogenase-like NADP-dependent oxidoreductase|uniref:saccharopine dehydrogenase family protein n=1 Tax=Flavihumibacter profundi TaxID=2716883 RepID=UPI001CC542ED|nr:saccharopine dehydrogenase C-terminal domain-containing protein [Flavihumibacter profundi]MBZ5855985.1 saccharopine dehydrogenase NADP-binding domain-containing protein [Flavihumibacter profundi]